MYRVPLSLYLVSLSLKLLLFPTPPSTDFEVHRHWKSLTYSLPLRLWYSDTSSVWTLDYPPLFAYFERLLAFLISLIHPALLLPSTPPQPTGLTLFFMRLSVLLADPILLLGIYRYAAAIHRRKPDAEANINFSVALVALSPGLILVDNIHFQYNALPLGVLLCAMASFTEGSLISGAILFSLAVNLKHTLLPLAPVIAAYILHAAWLRRSHGLSHMLRTAISVAFVTIFVFGVIWMPIYLAGGLELIHQVFRRMFPFGRGLLHSYWAPNFWAVYAGMDKVLAWVGMRARIVDVDPASGKIGGMRPFAVLWNPSPVFCATAVLGLMLPVIGRMISGEVEFGVASLVAGLGAFVGLWHVHEKAVLVPLVLMSGMVCKGEGRLGEAFLWLSIGGQLGLFALVQGKGEGVFKVAHFVAYHIMVMGWMWGGEITGKRWTLIAYLIGGVAIEIYGGVGGVHRRVFEEMWQFLPLMMSSLYSAMGVLVAFGVVMWVGLMERTAVCGKENDTKM